MKEIWAGSQVLLQCCVAMIRTTTLDAKNAIVNILDGSSFFVKKITMI